MRHLAGLLVVLTIVCLPLRAEEPGDVLERAIKAHGGADKLMRLQLRQEKTRGKLQVGDKTIDFTLTTVCQLPEQFHSHIKSDSGNRKIDVIQVLNGNQGWICDDGRTLEAAAQALTDLRELAHVQYLSTLLPLRNAKVYTLKLLPEVKVHDKAVIGLLVTRKDRRDVRLFFDKETALLVKREFKSREAGKESLREEFLSEFKETEGLQQPQKYLIHQDGKKYAEATLVELKLLKQVVRTQFERP